MSHLRAIAPTLILFAAVGHAEAADTPTTLDLSGKAVKKLEVSQSQIGYTSTTVFYTLSDQRVIVVLRVENAKKFPVSGKVCQFGKDVTAEEMAKWVNNQHSDGLFPDVPEPVTTTKLAAEACKTGEAKSLGKVQGGQGEYEKYSVEFTIEKVKVNDQLHLAEFKEKVSVFVPTK
jgi:hypothetical protein